MGNPVDGRRKKPIQKVVWKWSVYTAQLICFMFIGLFWIKTEIVFLFQSFMVITVCINKALCAKFILNYYIIVENIFEVWAIYFDFMEEKPKGEYPPPLP